LLGTKSKSFYSISHRSSKEVLKARKESVSKKKKTKEAAY